eukprot:CAMPEP_0118889778 /NCGR_PEP_ID=MMETSP1166-20130328/538_1 /TAXON_ID=1104430 /ORGANISM="Chrysoreinhardia sp, Strain CCMP3193" /LENGTH=604 /DNA_ID=CAMNT_0006828373 /DNA_START=39 /DNA_END=1853 /DNA_ORIENTATION=-
MGENDQLTSEEKVRGLRVLLVTHGLDGVIVPTGDAHASEYVAACDERRAWLTGFKGSAGTALVTKEGAYCWTDGRYFLQAEKELDPLFKLMRLPESKPGGFCRGLKIGVDYATCTFGFAAEFQDLVATPENFVDVVWGKQRPRRPQNPVVQAFVTGESSASKIRRVREALDGDGLVVNALDQIAWLLNLRGSDVECNPVFFSYLALTAKECVLFADHDDLTAASDDFEVRPYSEFSPSYVASLDVPAVRFERGTATLAMTAELPAARTKIVATSPVEEFKAVKNEEEIEGLQRAQLRDAVVITSFFAWLTGNEDVVTETRAAEEITKRRGLFGKDLYKGDSFPTISAAGANGAIIHYSPSPTKDSLISGMYLCDTGAHYRDGTTDITRTIHVGVGGTKAPEEEQRLCYTLVLQGHVDLAKQIFPDGISGLQLDAIARAPLWQRGYNFNHGTGHGIGARLNVHEGPFGIGGGANSAKTLSDAAKLKYLHGIHEGYYLSDEPGVYLDGQFGVRVESDLLVTKSDTYKGKLQFESLTLVPYCRDLIDVDLLTTAQRQWIDEYHVRCLNTVGPALKDSPMPNVDQTLAWLRDACQPLPSSSSSSSSKL